MKIWFYSSNLPIPQDNFNPRPGRLRILAEGLAGLNHDVTFWTSSFDHANRWHQKSMEGKQYGVDYRVVKSLGYKKNVSIRRKIDYEYAAYLLKKESFETIKKEPNQKPDIIFVNWPSLETTTAAIKVGKEFEIPVIVGVSDLWPDNWSSSFPAWLKKIGNAYISLIRKKASNIISDADAITGLTQEYLNWATDLADDFKGSKFILPMTYEDPGSDRDLPSSEAFIISFAGTFNHQFDFDWLYQLAEYLKSKDSEIEFLLAGDGDSRKKMESKFKKLSNVKFLGFLQKIELEQLLKRSSLGVAHYKNTDHFKLNLPNKPIEYLANSLPIVCPIEGCIMELIDQKKVGISAYKLTIEETGNYILKLKNNPDLFETYRKNARKTYEEDFHPNNIIKLLEEKMNDTISKHNDKFHMK